MQSREWDRFVFIAQRMCKVVVNTEYSVAHSVRLGHRVVTWCDREDRPYTQWISLDTSVPSCGDHRWIEDDHNVMLDELFQGEYP